MDLPLKIHETIRVHGKDFSLEKETLAVEAPLTIAVNDEETVTLRTPGHDRELCLGFLYTEGVIAQMDDVLSFTQPSANRIETKVAGHTPLQPRVAVSSCGLCGSARLAIPELLAHGSVYDDTAVEMDLVKSLPERMAPLQTLFIQTGATHAAALFDPDGQCIALYEDIGRHNALDKLLGFALQNHLLPFSGILCLSGRAGFELISKAAMAGIPIVCSVSAPSALAVELAESFNITLIGFLRGQNANIYCGKQRIRF
jgi:FdhD protein